MVICFSVLLGRIVGSYSNYLTFGGTTNCYPKPLHHLHPHQQYMRVPISPRLYQYLLLSVFSNITVVGAFPVVQLRICLVMQKKEEEKNTLQFRKEDDMYRRKGIELSFVFCCFLDTVMLYLFQSSKSL